MAGMTRAQTSRGVNDDTYVDVDEDDGDGDRPEPGDLEFSDDEEEPMENKFQTEVDESEVEEWLQQAIPGSLEEWPHSPANAEDMLGRIEGMRSLAAGHGLGGRTCCTSVWR